jgi:RNA polymerase sigma-70 factor (ECF subfamily)
MRKTAPAFLREVTPTRRSSASTTSRTRRLPLTPRHARRDCRREDVTQTTFLNAYRAFQQGTRPEKPKPWLITIAHNVCRSGSARRSDGRTRSSSTSASGKEREDDISTPSAEDLRRALSQLAPNQRAAIVMRELEGSSYAEIAEVLGISVSALETVLFRARRALREQLEEQLTCQEAAFALNKQLDGGRPAASGVR